MLLIANSVINVVSTSGSIGDCYAQDFNGDGLTGQSNDTSTLAFSQCDGTRNNGMTTLNILSTMMIIGGVIVSIRVFISGT